MAEDWARPVVHWEIQGRDPQRLREFYGQLFHWQIGDGPIMMIPPGVGAPEAGPSGHIRQGDNPGVTLYVQVRDLRATLLEAVNFGGKVQTEPFDVPNGPTVAAITDPEGTPLMLVQQ